jgi:hypothetical protein
MGLDPPLDLEESCDLVELREADSEGEGGLKVTLRIFELIYVRDPMATVIVSAWRENIEVGPYGASPLEGRSVYAAPSHLVCVICGCRQ